MTRTRTLLAGAMTLLALTGCTLSPPAPEPTTTVAPTPEATPEEPAWTYSTPSPTAAGPTEIPDDSLIDEEADEDARAGAAAAATVTAEIWVQGATLDQREWNGQLMETLTPIAQQSYTDKWWGYRVAETEITGEPEIIAATMSSATVAIPTNAGPLTLTVTRLTPTDSWLTSGIEPAIPEQ
ncbi:MAG: hypothetical protein ACTHYR_04265 [Brachybacterium sp.]